MILRKVIRDTWASITYYFFHHLFRYIKKYAATHHEPQRKSLCLTKNPFQNQTVISRFPLFPVKQSIKSTLNLITKNLNLLLLT